jgi:hypothetical protein
MEIANMALSCWFRSLKSVSDGSRSERNRVPGSRKPRGSSSLWLEPLEERTLLDAVHWIGGSGDWADPSH